MSVHVLRCPNCGAELQIAETSETIRCNHCGTRCHVEGTGAGLHLSKIAKQIERIEGHAAKTAAEIEAMRVAQERGLSSQSQTEAAMRRAASAQEAAAKEAALAARLVAAREIRQFTEEVEKSGRELAEVKEAAERRVAEAKARLSEHEARLAQYEADRAAALALRSQYRMSRVWSIVAFPVVLGCVGAAGLGLLVWRPADWVMTLGKLLFLGSPFVALTWSSMTWSRGTEAGRKFNESAFSLDLPLLSVKSKSQHDAAGGCTSEMSSGCGCVAFIVLAIVLWAVGHYGSSGVSTKNAPTPTNQPDGCVAPDNSPANTPPPAANSESEPPSNSAPPSNSPSGNTAPPANGESAPANNAPRSD